MRELRKKLDEEKEEVLRQQWKECERLKEIAVEQACTALRKHLRNEFAVEREGAIAEALRKARVGLLLCFTLNLSIIKAPCNFS